ncbi:MAG: NAD-dependent epimerase/dehydratase family protein [Candidatus Vogelbacteria bacterium]|nr:NAD-dependent epimerase/dehydratase family protein [Candidatus Vogelbacteria bacterium]
MFQFKPPKIIMITGAAGYIGAILCDQFSKSPDVEQIIAIDRLSIPELLKDNKKIIWITANLYQNIWKIPALINKPEVVIHAAWQTNGLFGNEELQTKLNIESSQMLFEFAFKNKFVKKLIFLSDIFVYDAAADQDSDKPFDESDEPKETEYVCGRQKREVENKLRHLFDQSDHKKQVFVLRLSSIFGPRRNKLGIGISDPRVFFSTALPVVVDSPLGWTEQYVHEDDVTDAVAMFTFSQVGGGESYEVYILSPNDFVTACDMGENIKKRIIKLPAALIRVLFSFAWYLSGGKLPTGNGWWKVFCNPLLVDGSKITKSFGFEYLYKSKDVLKDVGGRYENTPGLVE